MFTNLTAGVIRGLEIATIRYCESNRAVVCMAHVRRDIGRSKAAIAAGVAVTIYAFAHGTTRTGSAFLTPSLPSAEMQLMFEREGHVVTRGLLGCSELKVIAEQLRNVAKSEEIASAKHAAEVLKQKRLDGIPPPFIQVFNPHRRYNVARELACSPVLASMAAALLGVQRVRLYQDCLFWKRPDDDGTAWHADLWTVPLATNSFVTVWLPLQRITLKEAPLYFQSRSHRDLASREHEYELEELGIDPEDVPPPGNHGHHYAPLELGDATWHHGWTIHGTPKLAHGASSRLAYAATYFEDGATVLPLAAESEDEPSYEDWIADIQPGDSATHSLLPLVYPSSDERTNQA